MKSREHSLTDGVPVQIIGVIFGVIGILLDVLEPKLPSGGTIIAVGGAVMVSIGIVISSLRSVHEELKNVRDRIGSNQPAPNAGLELFLNQNGKLAGPYSYDQVVEMLQNGEIDQETQCSIVGTKYWQTIGSMKII